MDPALIGSIFSGIVSLFSIGGCLYFWHKKSLSDKQKAGIVITEKVRQSEPEVQQEEQKTDAEPKSKESYLERRIEINLENQHDFKESKKHIIINQKTASGASLLSSIKNFLTKTTNNKDDKKNEQEPDKGSFKGKITKEGEEQQYKKEEITNKTRIDSLIKDKEREREKGREEEERDARFYNERVYQSGHNQSVIILEAIKAFSSTPKPTDERNHNNSCMTSFEEGKRHESTAIFQRFDKNQRNIKEDLMYELKLKIDFSPPLASRKGTAFFSSIQDNKFHQQQTHKKGSETYTFSKKNKDDDNKHGFFNSGFFLSDDERLYRKCSENVSSPERKSGNLSTPDILPKLHVNDLPNQPFHLEVKPLNIELIGQEHNENEQ